MKKRGNIFLSAGISALCAAFSLQSTPATVMAGGGDRAEPAALGRAGSPTKGSQPGAAPAIQQKHPKGTNKLSICFSPYTNGLSPETNSAVPMSQLLWQLSLTYPYADTIRLFGVSGELEKVYKPAKEEYHYRIIAGGWIAAGYSEEMIYAELDKLVELANKGYVDIAAVGSETIYRGDFSADQLIGYMNYVRERVKDKSIPIATSDTSAAFLQNPKLVEASDVILCTIYPYFSNVNAENASKSLIGTYEALTKIAKGRQVIVSESGWPTAGSAEGQSVPNSANAQKFFEETYAWSRANDVEVVFFEEMDEAWKLEGSSADVGGHWGHWTSTGMLKPAYYNTYQTISSAPVLDIDTVKWAESAISELVGQGIADPKGPSLYDPLAPITRGDFIHFLVKALSLEEKTGRSGAAFLDVDPNIYYYYTVGAGQKAGLVAGASKGMCQPGANITRQDMFALIYRALKYAGMDLPPSSAALAKFKDAQDISEYAKDSISALAAAGLATGDPKGMANPKLPASRAEAAVLLHKVYARGRR